MTTTDKATPVVEHLESLGSPGAIADYLIERNVTGDQQTCDTCPVAVHIRKETAEDWWLVGTDDAWIPVVARAPGQPPTVVPFGGNVSGFISNFDDGEYPELVKASE